MCPRLPAPLWWSYCVQYRPELSCSKGRSRISLRKIAGHRPAKSSRGSFFYLACFHFILHNLSKRCGKLLSWNEDSKCTTVHTTVSRHGLLLNVLRPQCVQTGVFKLSTRIACLCCYQKNIFTFVAFIWIKEIRTNCWSRRSFNWIHVEQFHVLQKGIKNLNFILEKTLEIKKWKGDRSLLLINVLKDNQMSTVQSLLSSTWVPS